MLWGHVKNVLGISQVEAAYGQVVENPDELGYTFITDAERPKSSIEQCNEILPFRDRQAITGTAKLSMKPVSADQLERIRATAAYDKTAIRAYDAGRW